MIPFFGHLIPFPKFEAPIRVPKLCRNGDGRAYAKFKKQRTYFKAKDGTALMYGTAAAVRAHKKWLSDLLGEAAAEAVDVAKQSDDNRTIAQLAIAYVAHADRYYRRDGKLTSEIHNVRGAMKRLVYLFGGELIKDFGPAKLAGFRDDLVEKGYKRKRKAKDKDAKAVEEAFGYCRNVINARLWIVKRCFRWGTEKEFVKNDLYHRLLAVSSLAEGRSAAIESKDVPPVPHEHWKATLPFLSPTVAAMVQAQYMCGMRPEDVCRTRLCDIDMSQDIWLYFLHRHKTGEAGELCKAIPPTAQTILRPFLARDAAAFLFDPREPAYSRSNRDHYDTNSYRRAVKRAIDRANNAGVKIPHWHPHQLRRTIATLIRQSLGQQASQCWLGHETLDATQIYAEKQVNELVEIARQLDRRWAGQAACGAPHFQFGDYPRFSRRKHGLYGTRSARRSSWRTLRHHRCRP